jgi:hypothetical protein
MAKAKSTDDSAKAALFYFRTHRYKKTGRRREYGKSAHLHLTAFHAQSLIARRRIQTMRCHFPH